MSFWIFMLLMTLLIPISMIGFGYYFSKKAPKEINNVLGYRTSRSMKNKETWQFAHNYFGKLWFKLGLIVLIASIIIMLIQLGQTDDMISLIGSILCMLQIIFLLYPIIPTERALKNTFDEKGQRYCPSGLNKKSFSIPFHGGEIWIEHLDSFGNEITLLKQKFIEDIPQISQPSTSSLIAINLDESHIDKEILSWILDTLSSLPAPPQKVVFIGLTPKLKWLVKLKQKQITFLVTCIDDFEKAKEWLL